MLLDMNQSLKNLNPNTISKLPQEDPTGKLIEASNLWQETQLDNVRKKVQIQEDEAEKVKVHQSPDPPGGSQRKKVAKVKPNPRSVENLSVVAGEPTGDEAISASPAPPRPLTPVLPAKTPPIFESGVDTECIQLIRQLWNLREEASDFLQRASALLLHCRKQLRLIEDEDGRDSKGISNGKLTLKSDQKQNDLSPVDSETSEGKGPLHFLLRIHELDKSRFPASLSSFNFGLKSITDSVIEIEKQFNVLSVFHAQCKLVLYAKVS